MSAFSAFWLRTPPWKAFALVVALPWGAKVAWWYAGPFPWQVEAPIEAVSAFLIGAWAWAIYREVPNRLPEGVRLRGKGFFPFAFFLALGWFKYLIFEIAADEWFVLVRGFFAPSGLTFDEALAVSILMGMGGLFCIGHLAKTIRSAELGRSALFGEWAGTAGLFLVYPLGVWFIQPRLNRLAAKPVVE